MGVFTGDEGATELRILMPKIFTRAILPRKKPFPPKPNVALKVIEDAVDKEVKPLILSRFKRVVKGWDGEPEFKARKKVTQSEITLFVFPSGPNADKWRFVSGGTKPHIIVPKAPGYPLRFQWGGKGSYKAKTTTRGGHRGPGKVVGANEVRFMKVKHPGNKPRNFEKHIARWTKPKIKRILDNAMKRAKRKL